MKRFAFAGLVALLLTSDIALAQGGATLGNPNPAQWKRSSVDSSRGTLLSAVSGKSEQEHYFTCRPPDCPVRATVFFNARMDGRPYQSAAPRRAFLEEHEATMAGSKWSAVEPMKEGRLKGRAAYSGSKKVAAMGLTEYSHIRIIFEGDTVVTIAGNSVDSAAARRALELFLPLLRFGAWQ